MNLSKLPYGKRQKLESAINRVRWFLCGRWALHAANVTDLRVARFVNVADDKALLDTHYGLGIDGLALLRKWAKRISKAA